MGQTDQGEIKEGTWQISSLLPSTDCSKRQFLHKTFLGTSTWLNNSPAKQPAKSVLNLSWGTAQLNHHHPALLCLLAALLPSFLTLTALNLYTTMKLSAHNPYLYFLGYWGRQNSGPWKMSTSWSLKSSNMLPHIVKQILQTRLS